MKIKSGTIDICKCCGKKKRIYCRSLCNKCYTYNFRTKKPCKVCGKMDLLVKGRCNACYQRYLNDLKIKKKCIDCGKSFKYYSGQRCSNCARKHSTGKIIICKNCGKERKHKARGYCENCYHAVGRRDGWLKKVKCKECGKIKSHKAKGLCNSCYHKLRSITKYKNNPEKNKIKYYKHRVNNFLNAKTLYDTWKQEMEKKKK